MNSLLLTELFFIPLLIWPVLSLLALIALRRSHLESLPQAVWVLIILIIPFLGAIAFWIVDPSRRHLT